MDTIRPIRNAYGRYMLWNSSRRKLVFFVIHKLFVYPLHYFFPSVLLPGWIEILQSRVTTVAAAQRAFLMAANRHLLLHGEHGEPKRWDNRTSERTYKLTSVIGAAGFGWSGLSCFFVGDGCCCTFVWTVLVVCMLWPNPVCERVGEREKSE